MGPFDLDDAAAYAVWRDAKLVAAPANVDALVVEMGDIAAPTAAERDAILARVRRANMAVYAAAPRPGGDDRDAIRRLAGQLGLVRLDGNALADGDGITPLCVHRDGARSRYIPYTDRPIAWHTDGYYNTGGHAVLGLMLHCTRPARQGGANRLMDPELLYIRLRDENPGHVAALMRPDAMTIPGNEEEGLVRSATVGPVYFLDGAGRLAMRYTARARNVEWSPDPAVQAAAAAIRRLLADGGAEVFEHRLEAGQGLVCNNVLHTREAFVDDPAQPRLLLRARFHDRVAGT
ncbi:MAG: TauD/TfdA family dioxygenase [Magnetospirillum sp.]|nr:TauD/TfdA family dioxygenase [Magnetospirillum sp.]